MFPDFADAQSGLQLSALQLLEQRIPARDLDLTGRFDGYWERGLSAWEFAAGVLLVREAGGFVTDLNDQERTIEAGDVIAGNEFMHRELLGLLQKA